MKRKIVFKGKLSHSKEWIEGNLIIAQNGKPYIIPFDVFEPDGHHLIIDSDNPFWVDEDTVSQFTGEKDCNGKEIYESDIVSVLREKDGRSYIGVIEYIPTMFYVDTGFKLLDNNLWKPLLSGHCNYFKKIEVIGTIFKLVEKKGQKFVSFGRILEVEYFFVSSGIPFETAEEAKQANQNTGIICVQIKGKGVIELKLAYLIEDSELQKDR